MRIRIAAQYYENYNTSGEGAPHWKPKGGQVFIIECEDDTPMWSDDLQLHLETLVAAQSNSMAKYEYLGHEVEFGDDRVIPYADLLARVEQEFADDAAARYEET